MLIFNNANVTHKKRIKQIKMNIFFVLYPITFALITLIVKKTNLQNWLIVNQYRKYLIPKTKMYDCILCLNFWINLIVFFIYSYLLF